MQRLSEVQLIELYTAFLASRGYSATKIREGKSKTPDLSVVKGGIQSYNEFKAPELIMDSATGMYKFKTTISKLLRFINTAAGQLETQDPQHGSPWICTFASTHYQLHWKNFTDALQGGVVFDGRLSPDFTKSAVFQAVSKEIRKIDMYLWLQVSVEHNKLYQATYIINATSGHKDVVQQMANEMGSKPLGPHDNSIMLT